MDWISVIHPVLYLQENMMKPFLFTTIFLFLIAINIHANDKPYQQIEPLQFTDVHITDELWLPRILTNYDVSIPHNIQWCKDTGRIDNFAKAGGLMEGGFEGLYFNDSDVYKVIEGAAYALAWKYDAELDRTIDEIIEKIAAAQQADGYLNTYFILEHPDEKWTNLRDKHELYCAGHLIEAAIAHHKATGKKTLLQVAIRFADLIDSIFGEGKRYGVPGHEEIELALIKLYHHTGEHKYFKLAQFFIEQRGRDEHRELFGEYAQDHIPVQEQHEIFGHAVRAMYLFSGIADETAVSGNSEYKNAMNQVWQDMVSHKMYITGGIGVSGYGEGFAAKYDLPNEKAYAETCSTIALAFFNHRLNGLFADAKYMDVFERSLYNGFLSSVSISGDSFFYRNPLASCGVITFDPSGGKEGNSHKHRQPWFKCACCPPNVIRFMQTLGSYIYSRNEENLYINLFISSHTDMSFNNTLVSVRQETNYPWDEDIRVNITPGKPVEFTVMIRIPDWCADAEIRINNQTVSYETEKGYARIKKRWEQGDQITLHLPMPIRRVKSHPLVLENTGRVALMRGPLVYCIEEADNDVNVNCLVLPRDGKLNAVWKPSLLGGVTVI